MRTSPPLLAPIFRSNGQAAILAEILLTGETVSLPELIRRTGLTRTTVHREVTRLAEAGILLIETLGREWHISANPDNPVAEHIRAILAITFGPGPMLTEALERIEGVETAAVFGSFAARASGEPGPPPADIDVLVLGQPDVREVYAACRDIGDQVGRPVNATVMTGEEWRDAVEADAAFAVDVLSHPTLALIGDLH
ncbi:helix-turn-helix domain-containing protein [Nocardioides sp. NPDC051685]|uniref:helix-turn-helix domain-containing protein n=1 Tax=Nocardioides sp. NPDC051685 TaxID=3364334 RepID=UPI0037A81E7D